MMLLVPVMQFSTIFMNHYSNSGIKKIGVGISLMHVEVRRFSPDLRSDFFRLHSEDNECGWCFCTAWWVPTWEGWSDRTAEENKRLRQELLDQGEYDGYLLYREDQPIGWCQVGRQDRLEKLVQQFSLPSETNVWAITCFLIAPQYRRQGMATRLLDDIIEDLWLQGAKRIFAFPKSGENFDQLDLWNGPLSMYLQAGFSIWKEDLSRPVLELVISNID